MSTIHFLIESGVNVNSKNDVRHMNKYDNYLNQLQHGRTPLHIASWSGRKLIACILIDQGANVDSMDDVSISTLPRYLKIVTKLLI